MSSSYCYAHTRREPFFASRVDSRLDGNDRMERNLFNDVFGIPRKFIKQEWPAGTVLSSGVISGLMIEIFRALPIVCKSYRN